MSTNQNGQQGDSSHKADGVGIVNVAPSEGKPKQVTYQDYEQQLKDLSDQVMKAESDDEIDGLKQKIAAIRTALSRRATKDDLQKQIGELSKKLSESAEAAESAEAHRAEAARRAEARRSEDEADAEADARRAEAKRADAKRGRKGEADGDSEDDDDGCGGGSKGPDQASAHGMGMIQTEQDQVEGGAPAAWFKDIFHASQELRKGHATFVG